MMALDRQCSIEVLDGDASAQQARCSLLGMACHVSRPQHKHTFSSCSTLSDRQSSASTISDSSSTSLYVDAEVVLSSVYSTQGSTCASPPSFAQAIFSAGSSIFPPRDPFKRLKADSSHRRTCSADSQQQHAAAMERHHADILAAQLFKEQPSSDPLQVSPMAERSHSVTSVSPPLTYSASRPGHRRARSMHTVTDILSADQLQGQLGQLNMSTSAPMLAQQEAASSSSAAPLTQAAAEAATLARQASLPPIAPTAP